MVKCNVIAACKVGVGTFRLSWKREMGCVVRKHGRFQSSFKWLLTNSGFGKFGDIKKELLTFYILSFSLTLFLLSWKTNFLEADQDLRQKTGRLWRDSSCWFYSRFSSSQRVNCEPCAKILPRSADLLRDNESWDI